MFHSVFLYYKTDWNSLPNSLRQQQQQYLCAIIT